MEILLNNLALVAGLTSLILFVVKSPKLNLIQKVRVQEYKFNLSTLVAISLMIVTLIFLGFLVKNTEYNFGIPTVIVLLIILTAVNNFDEQ